MDRNSICRMKSGHLNLKFMSPWCQLSGKKGVSRTKRWSFTRIRQAGMFLEMLVKRQLRGHMALRGLWVRYRASPLCTRLCSLPSVVSGSTLECERWILAKLSLLSKWDGKMPQDYCLFSCFHRRYLECWPEFFLLYASMLSLLLLFLQIMWRDK